MASRRFQDRPDISPNVMHLIRGDTADDAFGVLRTIVKDKRLRCGTGFIRGSYCCVCFTEAPINQLRDVLLRSKQLRGLQPSGVMIGKGYLFDLGGRPAIYQPDSEYELLPQSFRYRHVRYEPSGDSPI